MESSRQLLALAGVAVLLVTAGCAGLGSNGPADAANAALPSTDSSASTDRAITVSASGKATASPDQAVVRVAVEATGPDAATARDRLAADVSSMRQALRDAGIADDQVRTAYYDIRAERKPTPVEATKTTGGDSATSTDGDSTDGDVTYRAVHAFEITLDDVDRAGEIVDVAVTSGATRVDGVQFTLSEDARRSLREDALRDAMGNARSQADVLASAANLTITGVHAVDATESNYYGPRVAYATEGAGGTTIESGELTVSATVQVTYDVADA